MRDDHYTITVRKRPWWMWLLGTVWLLVVIFFLQTAIASHREYEPRAALISWVIVVVLAIAGAFVWFRPRPAPSAAPPPPTPSPPPEQSNES